MVGDNATTETKDKFLKMLEQGELNDKEIEVEVADLGQSNTSFDVPGGHVGMINIGDMISCITNK